MIQALMVIHNICIDCGDKLEEFVEAGLDGEVADDLDIDVTAYGGVTIDAADEGQAPAYKMDEWHKEEGNIKRDQFLDLLFPLCDFQ